MNDAARSQEEIISDVAASASALATMAEGWLAEEQWNGNVAGANATLIDLTRLLGELRRACHGQ